MIVDGSVMYKSKLKSSLHSDEITGTELKCDGNSAVILDKEELPQVQDSSSDVAVQATLSCDNEGEFTFSCLWVNPGNALIQCNIIDGWFIGVPEIPFESNLVDYEPPTKIRLRNNESVVEVNPKYLEPKKRCLPTSSVNAGDVIMLDESSDSKAIKENIRVDKTSSLKKGIAVKPKGVQVNLPINPNCESLRLSCSTNMNLLEGCSGFHGYSSITPGIDWKLVSLCGIQKAVFDRYLVKVCQFQPWGLTNKTALLVFLVKLKLGLSYSNLAIFFGSDSSTMEQIFNDTLDKVYRRSHKEIVWSSQSRNDLPSYFQGLYKESRVILVCSEIEVEQPKDEQIRHNLFSSSSRMYSYKIVLGMTPTGRVCFKSKPYEGRKRFKRVLKDCGFLSNVNSKDLILTRCITPEMEFMVKKGVLLVAPQPSDDSSADDVERDIILHIERCERRFKFFKVLNKIPISLSSRIDELCHVCCCLINELPPLMRFNQDEES